METSACGVRKVILRYLSVMVSSLQIVCRLSETEKRIPGRYGGREGGEAASKQTSGRVATGRWRVGTKSSRYKDYLEAQRETIKPKQALLRTRTQRKQVRINLSTKLMEGCLPHSTCWYPNVPVLIRTNSQVFKPQELISGMSHSCYLLPLPCHAGSCRE